MSHLYAQDSKWEQVPVRDGYHRWDKYAPYLAFDRILYTHSPRYELKPSTDDI